MKFFTYLIVCLLYISPAAFAADTLMDVLNKNERASYLDKSETQRIQYDERAISYLDSLYNMAFDANDPALESLAYDPHIDMIPTPQKPNDTSLKMDTRATEQPEKIDSKSGTKFMAGGVLDGSLTAPNL